MSEQQPASAMPLRLEWRTPAELADNPDNWRTHPDAQTKPLVAQMEKVGWAGAALFNLRTNRLIDGHARKKLPDHLLVDGKIPVLVGDWSEEQERLILATLDPLAAAAATNKDALGKLLAMLQNEATDLQVMLDGLATANKIDMSGITTGKTDDDATPAAPKRPVSMPGDLWLLDGPGRHRLLCGNSTEPADVKRLMDGQQADCLWTDPPYGVDYVGKTADALTIKNDGEKGLGAMLDKAFACAMEATKHGAAWYVAAPPGPQTLDFGNRLQQLGIFRQALAWIKDRFVLGRQDYNWQHETIYYGWKPGESHHWHGMFDKATLFDDETPLKSLSKEKLISIVQSLRDDSTAIRCPRPSASREHPTMKPVALILKMLFNSTQRGQIVLDLFGGSGSTMIAAEKLGRRAYLLELDPGYCDVICTRWAKFTERTPILEATGQSFAAVKIERSTTAVTAGAK